MAMSKELKSIFGFLEDNSGELMRSSIGSMTLKTPLLTASGTFGYGNEYTKLRDFPTEVLGGIILKSVTYNPRHGNPEPRFVETPGGLINSIGIQNIGVKKLVSEELSKLRMLDTNIIVSIAGNTVDEYAEIASYLNHTDDFEAVEVNISCPNVDKGGMLFSFDPVLAEKVTKNVKRYIPDRPVIIKLSPNAPDILSVVLACVNSGADAISLGNTFTALSIDIKKKKPILKRNFGGLSGPAIKPLALAIVAKIAIELRRQNENIPIIGAGGILTAGDVLEYMITGTSAVEVGTAIFYDPIVFLKIYKELKEYLHENETSIQKSIGTLTYYD